MDDNPRPLRPVTKTLWPPQAGTKKLMRRFGTGLLCVRYRSNAEGTTRYTTVEIVIEEAPIQKRIGDRTQVTVGIPYDADTRARAQQLGARWDDDTKQWRMPMRIARTLGLETHAHVVKGRHRK